MGSKHINFYRPEFQQEWFRLIETPRMIFGFSFFDLTENLGAKRNEKRLFFLQESCKTLHFTCTLLALLRKSLIINVAGEGHRTLVFIQSSCQLAADARNSQGETLEMRI